MILLNIVKRVLYIPFIHIFSIVINGILGCLTLDGIQKYWLYYRSFVNLHKQPTVTHGRKEEVWHFCRSLYPVHTYYFRGYHVYAFGLGSG